MPKETSAGHGGKTAQGPTHHSARQSTRTSTRSSTAMTPSSTPRVQFQQPQPDSLASQSLNDLLDLVQQQVRAEMQAQQDEAGQDECMYFFDSTGNYIDISTGSYIYWVAHCYHTTTYSRYMYVYDDSYVLPPPLPEPPVYNIVDS